jgi:oligosaccharide repeat unit polymerase
MIFVVMQISFLYFSIFKSKIVKEIPIDSAYIYHIFFIVFFCIGFYWSRRNKKSSVKEEYEIVSINHFFYLLFYTLCILGFFTSVITIAKVSSLEEYFRLLIANSENPTRLIEIRNAANSSGLKGHFKMLNYLPLGVFLLTSSFLMFYKFTDCKERNKILYLNVFALILSFLKILFSLERLTVLAILIVFIHSFFYLNKKIRIVSFLLLFTAFGFLKFVTSTRMNNIAVIDFIIAYCRLGISNFQLLIDNFDNWTFGMNTFLSPLYFISKDFNYQLDIASANVYLWGGAPQYFFGYLYMDFGIFSFIVILLLGILLGYIQNKINEKKPLAIVLYFVIFFAICTTIVIPIFRAVEFWVLIMIAVVSLYFVNFVSETEV